MEKAVNIICAVVIITVFSFMGYFGYQSNLRAKELDKKKSDCLDKEKELLDLAKKKIEEEGIRIVVSSIAKPSSNGHKKEKKIKLKKEESK